MKDDASLGRNLLLLTEEEFSLQCYTIIFNLLILVIQLTCLESSVQLLQFPSESDLSFCQVLFFLLSITTLMSFGLWAT